MVSIPPLLPPLLEIIDCRLKKNPEIKDYYTILVVYKYAGTSFNHKHKACKLQKAGVWLDSQPNNTQEIIWWMWQKEKEVWVSGTRTGSIQDSGTLAKVMGRSGVWQYRERARSKILSGIIGCWVGKMRKEIERVSLEWEMALVQQVGLREQSGHGPLGKGATHPEEYEVVPWGKMIPGRMRWCYQVQFLDSSWGSVSQ